MEREKEFTSQESLELITSMINKAKDDYRDTGVSALLWGSIITICSLVTFFNSLYWKQNWANSIWLLTILGVIPQILIARQERKTRMHKSHQDDLIGSIWFSYAITVFLLTFIQMVRYIPDINTMYLILYGIPTFTSGLGKRFMPMIIGGIACWIFAVLSLYTTWPYQILYNAAAAQLAWFIPGLILRRGYLKAKQQHV